MWVSPISFISFGFLNNIFFFHVDKSVVICTKFYFCRYVGALTGIFSFVLFLPFLFKENYGIQENFLIKDVHNVENSVNYLRSCSNVLDMNFGETNNVEDNKTAESISSTETTSNGFGSSNAKHQKASFSGE